MQAPMNEYYTDEEYQYALKQMYRMMEKSYTGSMPIGKGR